METLEQRAKKVERRGKIEKVILASVLVVGALGVAVLAPNVLQVLAQLNGKKRPPWSYRQGIKRAVDRLKEKGLIVYVKKKGKTYIELTKRGEFVLRQADQGRHVIKKKLKRWDKKWRIVIFDIPERKRYVRDRAREMLQNFGFVKLQGSVWIYPYECEELITLLKAELKIGKDLLYIVASGIEYDASFRSHFNL